MENNNIQVFVKYNGKTTTYKVTNKLLINDFKRMVSDKINVPIPYFYMISGNKILDDNKDNNFNISKYDIKKDSTIIATIRAHGNKFII